MSINRNIGRAPIATPGPLLDPFVLDNNALIHTAEDFTISIITISLELYTRYKQYYRAGEFDNNYFALVSQMGLGDVEKPIIKAHFLNPINQMTQNMQSLWAENVAVVEDFQKNAKPERPEKQRLYLSFDSFCQGLGQSTFDQVKDALISVVSNVGAAFPSLIPYTTMGGVAIGGINNILHTILDADMRSQVKTATFTLYPYKDATIEHATIGHAPLQTGAYVFFFETVDLQQLQIDETGIVTSSTNSQPVSPYIVVNIEKGINLAAGSIEQNLATEVLNNLNRDSQYPLKPSNQTQIYFDTLEQIGSSLRLATSVKRYFDLKDRPSPLSDAEKQRLETLSKYLKENQISV